MGWKWSFGRPREVEPAYVEPPPPEPEPEPEPPPPHLGPLLAERELGILRHNIKFFGYELARQASANLPIRSGLTPSPQGLASKACTQADMESDWLAYWCGELKIPVMFHRKVWELAYVLQAIFEAGGMAAGQRGLGFGCGEEPLPSYLTSKGAKITLTDLAPDDRASAGWSATSQHASSLLQAHHPHLVDLATFEAAAELRHVDMNDIPDDLRDYDYCWSICAFEHLGSISKGLDFVEKSLETLKPGGVAVHTTEFNFLNDEDTIDDWDTVLFQRRHFEDLHARLTAAGHTVSPLDFDVGAKPMDSFIDVPPYPHDWTEETRRQWRHEPAHLKLLIDGFAATCFGLVIRKAG